MAVPSAARVRHVRGAPRERQRVDSEIERDTERVVKENREGQGERQGYELPRARNLLGSTS
jgi:hypothetical protein